MNNVIYRKDAIEAIRAMQTYKLFEGDDMLLVDQAEAQTVLMMLPSARPKPKVISDESCELCKYHHVESEKCNNCGVRFLGHYDKRLLYVNNYEEEIDG